MTLPLALIVCGFACAEPGPNAPKPNVVLVITDDQGYGDLSCHGNPVLQTPHLDALYRDSVRLTDYHVDPTCSPTRAALYTGRYSTKTGVWHTIGGRSLLRPGIPTLGDVFKAGGYRTAFIGKWHLGDNAPLRARDRGFDVTVTHGGGGVGQTPDHWGNDYFGDTYTRFSGGREDKVTVDGYCTDAWFAAADDFITRHAGVGTDAPFLLVLSTNAPHAPYRVPDDRAAPYREAGQTKAEAKRANFHGMIANIDHNVSELRERLDTLGLAENTILIFTTDNGTAAGHLAGGYNAGMRGTKGSAYDGGHRVPLFIHHPAGGLTGGRDVPGLAAHIDVLPTLAALCGLDVPGEGDGADLSAALRGDGGIPGRTLCVHSQRVEVPEKWRRCAVMTDRWRLVNGRELYDIAADPGQRDDVAADHPGVVAELRDAYGDWWADLTPAFDDAMNTDLVCIDLGDEATTLTAHDLHATGGEMVPWDQPMIEAGKPVLGWWAVDVREAGTYRLTLRVRPPEAPPEPLRAVTALIALTPEGADNPGLIKTPLIRTPVTGPFPTAPAVEIDLPAGRAKLAANVGLPGGRSSVYFVTVERVTDQ